MGCHAHHAGRSHPRRGWSADVAPHTIHRSLSDGTHARPARGAMDIADEPVAPLVHAVVD
ncbi:MAG: hypothetical protein ACI4P5_08795 [Candidatus Fimadaptatus sp.]